MGQGEVTLGRLQVTTKQLHAVLIRDVPGFCKRKSRSKVGFRYGSVRTQLGLVLLTELFSCPCVTFHSAHFCSSTVVAKALGTDYSSFIFSSYFLCLS